MARMNITLVTETYPPEVNGVAMTLQRIVRELSRRGHQMTVVRPKQNNTDDSKEVEGVYQCTVTGLPLPGYKGLHFGLPSGVRMRKLWKKTKPDLVHVATEGPLGWSAIRAAKRLGIPVISSFHTNFHAYGKHYGFGALHRMAVKYLRYIHNSTLATFGPSDDLLKELEKEGFENLHLLGRGVDTDLFNPQRRDAQLRALWGVDEETPVAIYVGRIAKEKNIPLTIQAYEKMREQLPSLKLVLVGDGPEKEALQKQHPEIHFAGVRTGEDLARHYASGDLFLFGSVTETFGNVVTEAMASGLLVLAYDYAAPGRYIHSGQSGVLAPYNDDNAFLTAAQTLANDTASWDAMRKAARECVMPLSWASIVDGFESSLYTFAKNGGPNSVFNKKTLPVTLT